MPTPNSYLQHSIKLSEKKWLLAVVPSTSRFDVFFVLVSWIKTGLKAVALGDPFSREAFS
jgi:hypothetical protein